MKMKSYKIILVSLVLTILFSCDNEEALKDITFINCNECTADEPFSAGIRITLSDPYRFGSANEVISIDVFEGNLEDDVLFDSFQTMSGETTINLPVNKQFCITARYNINNRIYIAVNSVTPRVKYSESSCDQPCYYTSPRSLNMKLKRTK